MKIPPHAEFTRPLLFPGEAEAIREVLRLGAIYGYGNLIDRLKEGWRDHLVREYQLDADSAAHAAGLIDGATLRARQRRLKR